MWPTYATQWNNMKIRPVRSGEFEDYAQFAIHNKTRYVEIADASGVPWEMIAVIHRRESNSRFDTYLGNGQPLSQVTTEVPRGRGPFHGPNAFFDGAIDALKVDGLSSVKDWRLEKMLYFCQAFNGFGYHGPSPYIWGGTNIQERGKYIRDHVYDPNAWDTQPGCAPILWAIAQLDNTVHFTREEAI